jgi:dTMP kinase
MVVLFEGIDTSGKSTQIAKLAQKYPEILTTKEPGGTPFGQKAREILLNDELSSNRAELLLFLADRAEHYHQIIANNQDRLILSDRGFLSGMGYALANGDFSQEQLLQLNRFALYENLPQKIILFLTTKETLQKRTSEKSLDGIELRGVEYLLEVQKQMQKVLPQLGIDYLEIDATQSIETIHQKILSYLEL